MPANSRISADDLYLFHEGRQLCLENMLGAHPDGDHCHFAVWAPRASAVSVIGDWNGWDAARDRLQPCGQSGVWEGIVPSVPLGARYKYRIYGDHVQPFLDKADPVARLSEQPQPGHAPASIVWAPSYAWHDAAWMADRAQRHRPNAPLSIYEVHLGSFRRRADGPLSYRELAPLLVEHVRELGFTHVELMPILEHPFYGSWGYQVTGYFAPTSRYGMPEDLMYLIDLLHQNQIGVLLDWVPSHFPDDPHGLARFDGTCLYEHEDPRQGVHPDWNSLIFNYSRHEVRSFLLSSALYWLRAFHFDGLRVDGVASMLYLDYSRKPDAWVPNHLGGRENLAAIAFLRTLNQDIRTQHPDVLCIAEESTAYPGVTDPVDRGGLGFSHKWDMGWMHDRLAYLALDPLFRQHHHSRLTFRRLYAYRERFVLSLSHDEVVHLKGSLWAKMPGDDWQKRATLRLLLADQFLSPGAKLLFMGGEFAQHAEWSHERSLDWQLLDPASPNAPDHRGILRWVADLNRLYRTQPALTERDHDPSGFAWIDPEDSAHSVLTFLRLATDASHTLVVAFNFTPVPRHAYRVEVPGPPGVFWEELLNSDAPIYGGSGCGNFGGCLAQGERDQMAVITVVLPPLAAVIFRARAGSGASPDR